MGLTLDQGRQKINTIYSVLDEIYLEHLSSRKQVGEEDGRWRGGGDFS